MARLGDVFSIASGGTPDKKKISYYDNGTIPWVKTGDLKSKYVSTEIEHITEDGLNNSSAKLFPANTVLVAMYGATIGACSILPYEAATNQACAAFLPNEKVIPTYLYYFLNSKKEQFIRDGVGGAQPNISAGYLKNVQFDIIPTQQQINIVCKLDKLEELITLNKELLLKLDELVKSRFIELFGDPTTNPMGWKTDKVENHIDLLSGFPFDSSQYTESGINICGGLIIMPQRIEWNDCKHWCSIEGYEEYTLKENDIVIALDRPWISEGFKIAMVDATHLPALLIQRTARIRANDINQIYLMFCFLLGGFDMHCNVTGSLVPHISSKDIRSFSIMLPPLELQNKFAAIVEQTDKSKLAVQQSLERLKTLKKSLMQEYFG